MLTFDEAFNQAAGGSRSILLGNGFSQALNAEIFNYQNIFEKADFGVNSQAIRGVFNKFETFDFETVMNSMLSAAATLEVYDGDAELIRKIRADSESMKEALISAIANTHPELPQEISTTQYQAVRIFLSKFSGIFTLNYDLLMYWARNQENIPPVSFDTDDGFRARQVWLGYGTNQEVFFLHGGLHIFDTRTSIKKHAHSTNGQSIIEQVRENLRENRFPLFVSEPTSNKKLDKISHNPYLNYCYQALNRYSGSLFIYGHSMDISDKHIFDRIQKSQFSNVYVSIYGNPDSPENQRSRANARAFLQTPNLHVHFFDAASTPVWQEA